MTWFFRGNKHACHRLDKTKTKLTCLNKNSGIVRESIFTISKI
jgi:hypothetical protein